MTSLVAVVGGSAGGMRHEGMRLSAFRRLFSRGGPATRDDYVDGTNTLHVFDDAGDSYFVQRGVLHNDRGGLVACDFGIPDPPDACVCSDLADGNALAVACPDADCAWVRCMAHYIDVQDKWVRLADGSMSLRERSVLAQNIGDVLAFYVAACHGQGVQGDELLMAQLRESALGGCMHWPSAADVATRVFPRPHSTAPWKGWR
tara:strand:+ start:252 stop:860 length:609 start_codon:yes stop_codon:yes gene_type:complete